ncbi:ferredoxin [Mycobacterium sp. 050134]|uniref:ferredoxin n=1 Tax=Mycobacterium sp. 050134 TaxID=3096111 RepID=UPI002EDACC6A
MTVRVDRNKCSGIGLCEVAAATVFEVGEDGQSHVLDKAPAGADLSAAQEAAASCPTGAISIDA